MNYVCCRRSQIDVAIIGIGSTIMNLRRSSDDLFLIRAPIHGKTASALTRVSLEMPWLFEYTNMLRLIDNGDLKAITSRLLPVLVWKELTVDIVAIAQKKTWYWFVSIFGNMRWLLCIKKSYILLHTLSTPTILQCTHERAIALNIVQFGEKGDGHICCWIRVFIVTSLLLYHLV